MLAGRSVATALGLVSTALVSLASAGCGETSAPSGGSGGTSAATGMSVSVSGTGGGGGAPTRGARVFASGTRIHARVLELDQGASRFEGFDDVELGISCSLRRTHDGVVRCMPEAFSLFFLDAACSVPVAWLPACKPSAYVSRAGDDASACDAVSGFRTTAPIAPVEVFISNGVSCQSVGPPPGDMFGLEAVADDEFVSFEPERETVGDGVARDLLATSDGAYIVTGALDVARQATCVAEPIGMGGSLQCVPSARAVDDGWVFSDDACTERAGVAGTDDCGLPEAPVVIERRILGACDESTFFEVGPKIPAPFSMDSKPPVCGPYFGGEGTGPIVAYAVGAHVAPETLPPLAYLTVGLGASVVDGAGSGEIWVSEFPGFVESATGTRCAVREFADHALRCATNGVILVDRYYADAACTELLVKMGDEACGVPPFAYELAWADECADRVSGGQVVTVVRSIGDIYDGPTFFGPSCLPLGEAAIGRRLGPPVPFETFPEVHRAVK